MTDKEACISLREHIESRCELCCEVNSKALCKETALREEQMRSMAEALRLAREGIDIRLEGLNHLRQDAASKVVVDQLRNDIVAVRERLTGHESRYITVDNYVREHNILSERITEVRLSMGKLVGLLTGAGIIGGTAGNALAHLFGG